jgi:hypothetical protein
MSDFDPEILSSFDSKFQSQEIKDSDDFEKSAREFQTWFEPFKYDVIQPHFDPIFKVVHAIASHYRPIIQSIGSHCMFILIREAAPIQIHRVRSQIGQCLDKLVQIGHTEVLSELLPTLTKATPFVYDNPSQSEFHEFFMHYLETWGRDSTSKVAAFEYATEFAKMCPFLGMAASRYLRPALGVITKRMQYMESVTHISVFVNAVLALCQQCWPVISANAEEITRLVEIARGKGEGNAKIEGACQGIVELLKREAKPPVFSV